MRTLERMRPERAAHVCWTQASSGLGRIDLRAMLLPAGFTLAAVKMVCLERLCNQKHFERTRPCAAADSHCGR